MHPRFLISVPSVGKEGKKGRGGGKVGEGITGFWISSSFLERGAGEE